MSKTAKLSRPRTISLIKQQADMPPLLYSTSYSRLHHFNTRAYPLALVAQSHKYTTSSRPPLLHEIYPGASEPRADSSASTSTSTDPPLASSRTTPSVSYPTAPESPVSSANSTSPPSSPAASSPSPAPSPQSPSPSSATASPFPPTPIFTTPSTATALTSSLEPLLVAGPDGTPGPWQSSSLDASPSGGWTLSDNGLSITRIYKFRRFKDAWNFVEGVGALAKQFKQHPTLCNTFTSVLVKWTTHRDRETGRKGLSKLDVKLAAETARVAAENAPVGVGEENTLTWFHGGGRQQFESEVQRLIEIADAPVQRTVMEAGVGADWEAGRDADWEAGMEGTTSVGRDWVGEAELEGRVYNRAWRKEYLGMIRKAHREEPERVEEWKGAQKVKPKPGKREVPQEAEEARDELKIGGR